MLRWAPSLTHIVHMDRWAGVSNEIAGCTWQCWQFPLLIFLYRGLWTLDFKQIKYIFPTKFSKFLQINFGRTVSIWKSRLLGWCMHAWVLGGVEGVYKLVSVSHLAVLCPSRGIANGGAVRRGWMQGCYCDCFARWISIIFQRYAE